MVSVITPPERFASTARAAVLARLAFAALRGVERIPRVGRIRGVAIIPSVPRIAGVDRRITVKPPAVRRARRLSGATGEEEQEY